MRIYIKESFDSKEEAEAYAENLRNYKKVNPMASAYVNGLYKDFIEEKEVWFVKGEIFK